MRSARRIKVLWIFAAAALCGPVGPARAEGRWRAVGSTRDIRENFGLALLPDGRVLAAGGHAQTRNNPDGSRWRLIGTSEIYDPATEAWTPTGSLVETRQGIGALAVLKTGKVLLAGEHDTRKGAELFDPATGKWTATGPLNVGRGGHSTTLLDDGRVLAVGGIDYAAPGTPIFASAEIYDPATERWTLTGSMSGPRFKHGVVRLRSGKVLVAGGTASEPSDNRALATAEIYDPATGAWKLTGSLSQGRELCILALLPDGRVLAMGGAIGKFGNYQALASAEIYDPQTESWTSASPMKQARMQFAAVTLADGRVMAIGGILRPPVIPLAKAEIFDPASGTWTETEPMKTRRGGHRAILLPNGGVLAVGGFNQTGELTAAEVFSPD